MGSQRLVLAVVTVVSLATVLSSCSLIKDASKSDTARSKVGDCINVKESSMTKAKTEPIDCSKPEAVYKIVSTQDKKVECDKSYTSYTETVGKSTSAYLCLVPNFKEGQCYHDGGAILSTGYKYATCGTADATFKVLKRIEGTISDSACDDVEDADKYITLDKEKITFCTGPGKKK